MLVRAAAAVIIMLSAYGGTAYGGDVPQQQMDASGAYELEEYIPDSSLELMNNAGVELNSDGVGELSVDGITDSVMGLAGQSLGAPLSACLAALGASLLCAVVSSGARNDDLGRSYGNLTAAAAVMSVCVPTALFIDSATDAIVSLCRFSSVLVPVMAGLAHVGGHTASAAAYSGFTLAVIEGITISCGSVLVPCLRVLLGVSAAGALCTSVDLGRLTSAVEKSAKWMLGIMGVLLSGAMGVSSVAASAADGAAAKGVRFVISGTVPVVGGAISDAIGSVANCVTIVRSSVGAFGIIAGLFILLPPVVTAVLWLLGLNLTVWVAQGLGAECPAAAMRSVASVVSLTLGLLVFTGVVLTCSAGLIVSLRSV